MPESEESLPTAELDELCRLIEREWFGVLAGYRGFPTERLQPEDTDCVIEVFFVDEVLEESVIRGTYPQRKKLRRERGCHVSIVCHDSTASLSRYVEDVTAISERRFGGSPFVSVNPLLSVVQGLAAAAIVGQALTSARGDWRATHQKAYEIRDNLWEAEPQAA